MLIFLILTGLIGFTKWERSVICLTGNVLALKKNTPCLVGSKEGTGYHTEYAKEEKNICLIAAAAFMEGLLFLQINILIF